MNRLLPLAALVSCALAAPSLAQHVVQDDLQPAQTVGVYFRPALSPDGRWLAYPVTMLPTSVRVLDLTGAQAPVDHTQAPTGSVAPVVTPVLATDTRVVVLGERLSILDLTQPGAPVLAEHEVGAWAHDMALAGDGAYVAVRGGDGGFAPGSGAQLFELATGAPVGHWPSGWFPQDTQSPPTHTVVADDRHALVVNADLGSSLSVRVDVIDLQAPGGPTRTLVGSAGGHPQDLLLSPDGGLATVRSRYEVQLVEVDGANSQVVAIAPVLSQVGGLALAHPTAMTDTHAVALGVNLNGTGPSCTVHVLDELGRSARRVLPGWAMEVQVSPDGRSAFVLTTEQLVQLALRDTGTPGPVMQVVDTRGVDVGEPFVYGLLPNRQLAVTDEHVIVRTGPQGTQQRTTLYEHGPAGLTSRLEHLAPTPLLDVGLSADGARAVLVWEGRCEVWDLTLERSVLQHVVAAPAPPPGIPASFEVQGDVRFGGEGAVVTGLTWDPAGNVDAWYSALDLFDEPVELCAGAVNSTGASGLLVPTGSARASANDLVLWATDVPAGEFGAFRYGDQAVALPFGDGTLCIGGQAVSFPRATTGVGTVSLPVDATALPPGGGALVAGTTWHFQYAYRDPALPGGAGFSATSAVTVTIEP